MKLVMRVIKVSELSKKPRIDQLMYTFFNKKGVKFKHIKNQNKSSIT